MRYFAYSDYLKDKYGERVYKLPVNLPGTCPNRDGQVGTGGCIYCGEVGAAFENLPCNMPIEEQIAENMRYIGEKYKADKFIVYFQNYSNTYMPLDEFKSVINRAITDKVVEIAISTRPDCIRDEYLDFLMSVKEKYGVEISIELGLQSVNYHTLIKVNRGHTLAEFIDAVLRIKKREFPICAHVILNLPWDDMTDVIECAKILSALCVEQVKLHCLYILKETPLADMYLNNEFEMGSFYDYVDKVIAFIEHLHPDIAIQRIIGRAREEDCIFANYGASWWKIKDNIDEQLDLFDTRQGKKCDYLNGKALKKFNK